MITCSALNKIKSFTLHIIGIRGGDMIWPSDLQASNLQALPSTDEATEVATTTSLVVTTDGVSEPAEPEVQQTDASMSLSDPNQPFHPLDEARETESLDELQLDRESVRKCIRTCGRTCSGAKWSLTELKDDAELDASL
ncbi:unnamed protein product [Microthlaspi erraticum]|uniref:Uncharacterized protein n=1 Tax=Microthlaspi erraticum TaxID=1685480 RepID=A0A6D2KFU9_9BRAS|nr:unnamed protein product [Microthlaspi erraticum]